MEYRRLGNTDINVSVICLGTMTWGVQNTESEAHEQLDYALDKGVNFLDTAELYPFPASGETQGRTEQYIGSWLSDRAIRDKVIIATKIAGPGAYTAHIRETQDYTKASIAEAIDGSLSRLQTDYIDLYQIHWPARSTNFFGKRGYYHREGWENNIMEILEGLQDMVNAGKVRYVGISNETPWGMMEYLKLSQQYNLPEIQSIQNPYNLLNRTFEIGLAEMAIRTQTGLLAYSPMAFGVLSGKYIMKRDTPRDRLNLINRANRYSTQQSQMATSEYLAIAEKFGISLAQMSLAFVNQQSFVTSNIIGATTMDQLRENIGTASIILDKDCIKQINAIQNAIPDPAP